MSDIKIINAICCDDWRREDNGKFLLIGVYSGTLEFRVDEGVTDVEHDLAFFIEATTPTESTEIEFRFARESDDVQVLAVKGIIGPNANASGRIPPSVSLPIPKTKIRFDKGGIYALSVKVGDKKWKSILTIDVQFQSTQT